MSYDIEPRELFYNRTGNFSQTTILDKRLAEQFMRASDLRWDVVITDSDKKPEQSAVAVGQDVMAWRMIVPIGELARDVVKPKKFRQTSLVDGQYRIQLHDQIIDDDIRKQGPENSEDYERRYLARLRREVKDGLAETIRWEKLGIRTQFINWLPYLIFGALNLPEITGNGNVESLIIHSGGIVFMTHPAFASISNMAMKHFEELNSLASEHTPGYRFSIPPAINPRDWKHALLPTVPIDKWYQGRRFLAQNGNDLIIARS